MLCKRTLTVFLYGDILVVSSLSLTATHSYTSASSLLVRLLPLHPPIMCQLQSSLPSPYREQDCTYIRSREKGDGSMEHIHAAEPSISLISPTWHVPLSSETKALAADRFTQNALLTQKKGEGDGLLTLCTSGFMGYIYIWRATELGLLCSMYIYIYVCRNHICAVSFSLGIWVCASVHV